MKKIMALLLCTYLAGCASFVDGDYVAPATGKIAHLKVDNSKLGSPARRLRIVGKTTSGCIGSPMVTTDLHATNASKDIFRIVIPAGEKIVLQFEERIDQSNGWTDWYGDLAFTPEEGAEYEFYSYVKMPEGEYVKPNPAPTVMIQAAERYALKNRGQAAIVGVFEHKNNRLIWMQPENKKLPAEKSYGYCPDKK